MASSNLVRKRRLSGKNLTTRRIWGFPGAVSTLHIQLVDRPDQTQRREGRKGRPRKPFLRSFVHFAPLRFAPLVNQLDMEGFNCGDSGRLADGSAPSFRRYCSFIRLSPGTGASKKRSAELWHGAAEDPHPGIFLLAGSLLLERTNTTSGSTQDACARLSGCSATVGTNPVVLSRPRAGLNK